MLADSAERYGYRNSIQGLYRMAREEGLATWYKGVGPNVVRGVSLASVSWDKADSLAHHERLPNWRVGSLDSIKA
jgi:dicarboxylate transporter 10